MGKLFRILAVSNALAMALPLGWCCPSPVAAAKSETASVAPCPHCQPQRATEDESAPSAPESPEKCPCCQVRSTNANEQLSAAPVAQMAAALVAAIEPAPQSACNLEPTQFIHPPGPSLQILHCVWRC
jgi:hypothetical protein